MLPERSKIGYWPQKRLPTEAALLFQTGRANNEGEEGGHYVLMQQKAEDQKAQTT
jgi:hypothetical protein